MPRWMRNRKRRQRYDRTSQYRQQHAARVRKLVSQHRRRNPEDELAARRAAHHQRIREQPPADIEQLSDRAARLRGRKVNERIGRELLSMSIRQAKQGVPLETAIRNAVGVMEAMMQVNL